MAGATLSVNNKPAYLRLVHYVLSELEGGKRKPTTLVVPGAVLHQGLALIVIGSAEQARCLALLGQKEDG